MRDGETAMRERERQYGYDGRVAMMCEVSGKTLYGLLTSIGKRQAETMKRSILF